MADLVIGIAIGVTVAGAVSAVVLGRALVRMHRIVADLETQRLARTLEPLLMPLLVHEALQLRRQLEGGKERK